ncbi:MAG: hypothetical protein KF833_23380 [Verrucomicrobiae bacterium]|nr:hypothetical protein [Verrucomicrobiae bacterium]
MPELLPLASPEGGLALGRREETVRLPPVSCLFHSPLEAFLATLGEERLWLQVLVRRQGSNFELRHVADRQRADLDLRTVAASDLRTLAHTTAEGQFRPLKAAPNLIRGWRCRLERQEDLGTGLDALYPGSLADWWVVRSGSAQPMSYAERAALRPGRGGALARGLRGAALSAAIEGSCGPDSCGKHRRWTAPEVPGDDPAHKGEVPCLEPCPVFLAFAQTCARMELSPTVRLELAPADLDTLAAALRHARECPPRSERAGDFAAPLHPWRVARLLNRHARAWGGGVSTESQSESHGES